MAAMWMNLDLDKETDTGHEKTGTANGRRFHEKYDKRSKSGEYTVIVGNRFPVEIRQAPMQLTGLWIFGPGAGKGSASPMRIIERVKHGN